MECKYNIYECFEDDARKRKRKKQDNRLRIWERWLIERKKVHELLSNALGRSPGELLMNLNEEYRKLQEEKRLFQNATINTNFDKYRGNPAFWKLPVGLIDKCDPTQDPIYFTVKTKEERNEVPMIEYVGSPDHILKEKHIFPRTRNLYTLWQNFSYRKTQLEKLSSKIMLIEPHKPDLTSLVVVGRKICPNGLQENQADGSDPVLTKCDPRRVTSHSFQVHNIPRVCLIVNGTKMSDEECHSNRSLKVRLVFDCDVNLKVPFVQTLQFENKGVTVLRCYFKRFEKFCTFRDLIPKKHHSDFYFNKNELLIMPGKTIYLPVWFKPKHPGNYSQSWEIITVPKICGGDFRLIATFQGIVYKEDFEVTSMEIKQRLDHKIRYTLIKDLLNNIFDDLKYHESSPKIFTFSEEQIFECANQEICGTETRPKYLYKRCVVKELMELYKSVRQADDHETWNFSIKELKFLVRRKDILDYIEAQTKEWSRARDRRLELKQQEKTETRSVEPNKKLEDISGDGVEGREEASTIPVETNCQKLDNLLGKLERPSMVKNIERQKYVAAYFIMYSYFSKMCDALEGQTRNYYPSYDYQKVVTIDDLPERLIFERFDDIWVCRTRRVPLEAKTEFTAMPKPEILKKISPENTKMIYSAYFNKPTKSDKSSAKGKRKVEKSEQMKEKLDAKFQARKPKLSGVKTDPQIAESRVTEGFDPFVDEDNLLMPPQSTEKIETVNFIKEYDLKTEYDYETYLIVYTNLKDAICTLVDAIETLNDDTIATETLAELTKCNVVNVEEHTNDSRVQPEQQIKRSSEDEMYFQYLLDIQWNNNENAKLYLTEGKTKSSVFELSGSHHSELRESVPNLFKSKESVAIESIESHYTSAGIQTSYTDVNYKPFSNIFLNESVELANSNNVEEAICSTDSNDIFYFMNDGEEE